MAVLPVAAMPSSMDLNNTQYTHNQRNRNNKNKAILDIRLHPQSSATHAE